MHWDEAGFVEVNCKASGCRERFKDLFKGCSRFWGSFAENQGIVSVLEDGAGGIHREGVLQSTKPPSLTDKALEDVGNEDEKVRGKGVTLSKAIPAFNPVPGDTIQKDRGKT
jgi:hypothetical protein